MNWQYLNIKLNTTGRAEISACGGVLLKPSLKQEKECLVN